MTLFEKIASGEIPARMVHTAEDFIAFHDVNQQAPTHILIVPKRAIPRLAEAHPGHADLLGRMLLAARTIAADLGLAETGYRIVINNGPDAGESVPHLHLHLLGGRSLQWPPG